MEIEPDTALISSHLSVLDPSYAESNRELSRRVELLRESLPAVGLAKSDLKTTTYSVSPTNRFNQKEQKNELAGYTAHCALELRMPLDKERVSQTVEALSASHAKAIMIVTFILGDPEPIRARLLAAAVKTARARAETIAQAAGVQLGKIAHIHHDAVEIRSEQVRRDADGLTAYLGPDMNVTSYVWAEKVTVTWELVQ